jgi:hypothetical protein
MVIGSDYGSWDVDISLVKEDSIVYSFGIGKDATFETGLIEKTGCYVMCFDPTPSSIEWAAESGLIDNPKIIFTGVGVGHTNARMNMYGHKNPDYQTESMVPGGEWSEKPKGEVIVRTVKELMNTFNHDHIDLVKFCLGSDYEFDVVNKMLNDGVRPIQVAFLMLHMSKERRIQMDAKLTENNYNCVSHDINKWRVRYVRADHSNT